MIVPDWSDLHRDLLEQIAIKLNEFEDFTAFRGVCSSWRAGVAKDKYMFGPRFPLLLIPAKEGGDSDICEFYSWRKRKILLRIAVPESRGKRCISVGFGWILTAAFSDGDLCLVNPMSCANVKPPNLMTFPGYEYVRKTFPYHHFRDMKAVLSANPSETSDFVLMGAYFYSLGFWKNGDTKWTTIEVKQAPRYNFADICYHNQKMYAIDWFDQLWICDPYFTQTANVVLKIKLQDYVDLSKPKYQHLVESSKGELVLIVWDVNGHNLEFNSVEIIKIDVVKREFSFIYNLDGDAIFVGQNSAVSVAADVFPGVIKPDCIYYTNRRVFESLNMGIYNVKDRSHGSESLGLDVESFSCQQPAIVI